MDEKDLLIEVLAQQRNTALNALAQAQVQIELLKRQLEQQAA